MIRPRRVPAPAGAPAPRARQAVPRMGRTIPRAAPAPGRAAPVPHRAAPERRQAAVGLPRTGRTAAPARAAPPRAALAQAALVQAAPEPQAAAGPDRRGWQAPRAGRYLFRTARSPQRA